MIEPKASLILDKRVVLEDKPGIFPISLQFYFDGKRANIKTGQSLNQEDFDLIIQSLTNNKSILIRLDASRKVLKKKFKKAESVIEELKEDFTLARARKLYLDNSYKTNKNSLFTGFDTYMLELEENDQIKTSDSYKNAKNSLKKFRSEIIYSDITPEFLESYEKWMIHDKKKSRTTLAIYLRNLRSILNIGITKELITIKSYPFGKGKYIIPTGRNVKKALSIEHIRAIKGFFTVPGSPSDQAKDFFIFSYLSNGINFKDIAKLKNENIKGEQIHFIRAKTERTRRDYTPIKTSLRTETLEIITKWRTSDTSPTAFLFPILEKGLTARQETSKIQDFIKKTNKYLKPIGEALKLPIKLRTMNARHSFATIAINNGKAPIEYISEALGHSTLNTTRFYIDSFQDDRIKEITDSLL